MAWLLFVGMPGLLFVLGIPLALKLVPPNRFYGFRTATTFSSLEAWHQINFATGLALMAAGVVGGLAALLLSQSAIVPEPDLRYAAGVLLTAFATMLFLGVVAIYSTRV